LYSSPDIIRQIKSRRRHLARMGEERKYTRFWWENRKERDHLKDQGVDGRMGSKFIIGRLAGVWTGFMWLSVGTGGGLS
jgi:hypothetical protein